MADQTIQYTEEMVGSAHPTKSDTLNRLGLIGHTNDGAQMLAVGADIASAATITLPEEANYFKITGTTTITSIVSRKKGFVVVLEFEGILTFTHHPINLIMPHGLDVTTTAGMVLMFVEYDTAKWRLLSLVDKPGVVIIVANETIPAGFLECDGAAISRTSYGALFAAISTIHGEGDGSTTFNLPDYRGRHLRGWDNASGKDPDAGSRTAMSTGGAIGDNVGSVQSDAMQGHYHNRQSAGVSETVATRISAGNNSWSNVSGNERKDILTTTGVPVADGTAEPPRTSSETRGINAYVMYCIKY